MYQGTDTDTQASAEGPGREPILPPPEQWAELSPRPGSITWQRAGDARTFAAAGSALLLQVAHPTVGAGVKDFSVYAEDPWGRLWRTLDFVNVLVFAEPERAAEMGARIRGFHKVIKGTKPDGTLYHALEPEAYTWVHLTLMEGILRAHRRFGRPFSYDEAAQLWTEWRRLGRFLGIRWRDMPESYAGYRELVDTILAERLERNEAVDEVLESLTSAPPSPSKRIGPRTWKGISPPMLHLLGLATVGLLPRELRDRLDLQLSRVQALELRAFGRLSRALTPVMPQALRNVGPGYLRLRAKPIARGDVASPQANPHLAELLR